MPKPKPKPKYPDIIPNETPLSSETLNKTLGEVNNRLGKIDGTEVSSKTNDKIESDLTNNTIKVSSDPQNATEKLFTADIEGLQKHANNLTSSDESVNELVGPFKKTLIGLTDKMNNASNQLEQVKELISYRDTIIMSHDLAESKKNTNVTNFLKNLCDQTKEIFEKKGIKVFDTINEKFDTSKHLVSDVVKTDKKELHDIVSSTFRPGYAIDNELIRNHEVILYSYNPKQT